MIKALSRFLPFAAKYKFLFFVIVSTVILQSIAARWLPIIVGKMIDDGLRLKNFSYVVQLAIIYFIVQISCSVMVYLQTIGFQRFGNRILYDIREKLISHVQKLPITYFDKNPSGRIVTRVTNDVASLGAFFNQLLFSLFTSLVEFAAIIFAMLFISVKLTIISLVLSPLVALMTIKLTRKIKTIISQQKSKISAINAFVAENINGMSLLQLYNRVPTNVSKFGARSREYRDISLEMTHTYALLWPLMHFYTALAILIAIFYGGFLKTENVIQVGLLVAFFINVQDLHQPITNFLEKFVQLQDSLTSADRIFHLLDEPQEPSTGVKPPGIMRGEIKIKDLSFRYSENRPWVLNRLNLEIKPGETIGIVGKTGGGKTTLISLLQKFYDYQEGQILIDGHNLSSFTPSEWRKHLGVVQQDPFIFRGTIASNINLGNPAIDRRQIERAAHLSQCYDVFQLRNHGLDAIVEEKGANLSQGEKQLIAFARVLAFNPDILILDEATANIDSHTELLIQRAIKEVTQNRTSIIIAHRLSTLQDCHRIAVIDQHRIVELGSHAELMQARGYYYNLHTKHFNSSSASLDL